MSPLAAGGAGFVAGSALFLLVAAGLALLGRLIRIRNPHPPSVGAVARFSLLLGVMSGLEEVVFRAGMVGLGARALGPGLAIVAAALLFAAAHRVPGGIPGLAWINIGLVGMLLGLAYWDWGLWAAVGIHWGWNQWEWGLGFRVSGEHTSRYLLAPPTTVTVPRYAYGPEAHPLSTVVLALALAAVLIGPGMKKPGPVGPGLTYFLTVWRPANVSRTGAAGGQENRQRDDCESGHHVRNPSVQTVHARPPFPFRSHFYTKSCSPHCWMIIDQRV
jgi:hypothetical protein